MIYELLHTHTRRAAESLDMFFPQDLRLREWVEEYIASHGCSLGFNFQSAPLARSLSALAFNDHTSGFMRLAHTTALFFLCPSTHPPTGLRCVHFKPAPAVAVRRINEVLFDVVCKWKRLLFTASIYMRDLLRCRVCLCVVCRVCPLALVRALWNLFIHLWWCVSVSRNWQLFVPTNSICCLIYWAVYFCSSQSIDVLLLATVLFKVIC